MRNVYNFSAGPAVLPELVLQEAADEMLDYKGSGMSVMEISHRSSLFQSIIDETEQDLRTLMNIPDDYVVLFLQGGTSLQFSMIPMNFMRNGKADYILTGYWAKKAYEEAKQKNLAPAGLVIAIMHKDLISDTVLPNTPTMLQYKIHADKKSLYNTPPAYNIYMVGKVLKWIQSLGGLEKMKEINKRKASILYDYLDSSSLFYGLANQFIVLWFGKCRQQVAYECDFPYKVGWGILLIVDEVQTGVGRTGTFLCCEHYEVRPNVITLAKGLGAGLPIGAILMDKLTENILQTGDHGSTFGGNPVVCAGALEVLNQIANADFLAAVNSKSDYMREKLSALPHVTNVSGMGLMFGMTLEKDIKAGKIAEKCVENGLLILTAKEKLRIMPPLNISKEEIDTGFNILRKCLSGALS